MRIVQLLNIPVSAAMLEFWNCCNTFATYVPMSESDTESKL